MPDKRVERLRDVLGEWLLGWEIKAHRLDLEDGARLVLAEQDSWHPIETAPRDGTEILGWRDDAGALLVRWTSLAEFLTDSELADVDEETAHTEHWFFADFIQGGCLADDEAPTLWQAITPPEAPQDRGASQGDVG
jgi:hypothetical protein